MQYTLAEETTQDELESLVEKLNADPAVHGILVQLPLPRHLNSEPVIQSIRPEKGRDGLNVVNSGKVASGDLATVSYPARLPVPCCCCASNWVKTSPASMRW